jgi:hypothetical protein
MKIFLASLAVLVFSFNGIYSAKYTVTNSSGETVEVFDPIRKSFEPLPNTEGRNYNSGFRNVTEITWASGNNVYDAKVKLYALNLGTFVITGKDGSYSYYFGPDGVGKGKAEVRARVM